jgi:D-alanyl-lipoteichoic acid acyltransferase DltB (MBOAT superfamily)/lysophospholipase L1-like esterase
LNEFIPAEIVQKLVSADSIPENAVPDQVPDTLLIKKPDSIFQPEASYPISEINSFSPLEPFLDSLRLSNNQLRIMYYGDSQIEGDRVSNYLRRVLRKDHGGLGPGLFLPVMPVMYTKSIWLRSSPNWKRYNYLSFRTGEITHRNLGPFMSFCSYLPEGERKAVPEKAFVRIHPSNLADSAASCYENLRIFYGNTDENVSIKVKADNDQIFAGVLKTGSGIKEISCSLKGAEDILIEFEGNVSPDIYGISIESKKGIIVDNIPQRGSAGLEFTMVERNNLAEAYKMLSPDLIILNYGLNIVKNVRNDYSYFKKGLYRQLSLLKEVLPSTPVLVISVTAMAEANGDSIIPYRNIPAIIKAQREAARDAGAAFWDSYKAMGGKSSIIKWAQKKPALATKDYVHFTDAGADTFSKMLVEAMFSLKEKDAIQTARTTEPSDTVKAILPVQGNKQEVQTDKRGLAGSIVSQIFSYDSEKPLIFTTPAFWLFFLLVLAGYSLVYRKLFLRHLYLLLVSLFFYYKSGGLFLFLLILVTVIDFSCGLLMYGARKKYLKRLFILISLLSNLGILAYFKYTDFIISSINYLFGTDIKVFDFLASFSNIHLGTSFDISSIILPVGISFFTFQSLSYTIDVYRGKMKPVRNIVDFGFYVSFFPQLVAGPIVRASEFIPQLYKDFHLSKREFSHAIFLISKGLIKKIIISDFIAVNFVDRVFDLPTVYSGFENLMAIYGYGLQIYCDFSGYTDIAIGLGLIFGFRLPINFNSPYKAASVADFWKRWHISLSRWLKDYLYISLGGNRKGKVRTYINMMITMLLGGLWHGAALRFVIWGGLHGIGLVFNKLWSSIFAGSVKKVTRFRRALSVFITFQFVSFCWIFFRAADMNNAKMMLKQIWENFSPGSFLTVIPAYSNVFLLMAIGYIIHFLPEKMKESYRGLFIRIPLIPQMAIILFIAVLLYQMRSTEIMPFIYFRF